VKIKSLTAAIILAFVCALVGVGQKRSRRPTTPPPAPTAKSTLSIEAGIIYKSTGNQPVARTKFRLLDADLADIIWLPPDFESKHALDDPRANLIYNWALAVQYSNDKSVIVRTALMISQHTVQDVTTDFNGKAELADVKPGRYFLFARTETRGGFAVWNLLIEIKPGKNSVALDQDNAVVSF
jgi:hypothetical protein